MITALVPGSFDPPTNGHLDIIERCAGIFDRVVVAVANNPSKSPLFSADERVALLEECCTAWPNVSRPVLRRPAGGCGRPGRAPTSS